MGTPIRPFASRQGMEAQRCRWLAHCHRACQCPSEDDAISQAVSRDLALYPRAGDSPLQEGMRCYSVRGYRLHSSGLSHLCLSIKLQILLEKRA